MALQDMMASLPPGLLNGLANLPEEQLSKYVLMVRQPQYRSTIENLANLTGGHGMMSILLDDAVPPAAIARFVTVMREPGTPEERIARLKADPLTGEIEWPS